MLKKGIFRSLAITLSLVGIIFAGPVLGSVRALDVSTGSSYNSDIAAKLNSRCDLIKDYLSQTVRINELVSRQNKVRGWDYVLRQMDSTAQSYAKFDVNPQDLKNGVSELKKQLEQFKADFEIYDDAFQKLNQIDCAKQPEVFWAQLENVRGMRAGIALAAENFGTNLEGLLKAEEAKW